MDQDEELMSLLEERYKEAKEEYGGSKHHADEWEINLTKAKESRMIGAHEKPRKVDKQCKVETKLIFAKM
eukprot:14504877-Ditylum_brightwellii.AAC.1